jgi:hypothetical protein
MASKNTTEDSRTRDLVRKCGDKKHLAKAGTTDLQEGSHSVLPTVRESRGHGFFSFRYSYKEISLSGGQTRIRAKEHRFEDGKLSSEELEATMDEGVHQDAVEQTRDLVVAQVGSVLKLFSAFLPFPSRSRDK